MNLALAVLVAQPCDLRICSFRCDCYQYSYRDFPRCVQKNALEKLSLLGKSKYRPIEMVKRLRLDPEDIVMGVSASQSGRSGACRCRSAWEY